MNRITASLAVLVLLVGHFAGVRFDRSVRRALAETTVQIPTGLIAFESNRSGDSDIWTMDLASGETVNLTNDRNNDSAPTWSPDGQRVAFTHTERRNMDIWVMNADGSGKTQLTTDPNQDKLPSWSPDGSEIAFTSKQTGEEQLWVMNADGTNQRQLTNIQGASAVRHADWSPDGTKILFSVNNQGLDFYMYDFTTGEVTLWPISSPRSEHTSSWSPDGTLVAFHQHEGIDGVVPGRIFVAPADGSTKTRVTDCAVNRECDEWPDWSPDGQWLVFHRNIVEQLVGNPDSDYKDLYVLEVVTGQLIRLTDNNDVLDCCASWRPVD